MYFCHAVLCSYVLSINDYKIKVMVNSEKCWRLSGPLISKIQAIFNSLCKQKINTPISIVCTFVYIPNNYFFKFKFSFMMHYQQTFDF